MRIEYLDGMRLRRALVAGCDFVQQRRAELNRINVFPVPDGDTGTNLALTAAPLRTRCATWPSRGCDVVAQQAADAAILGARGNCGMILSHFLLGFADAVGDRGRVGAAEFADALKRAAEHVYRSLERPVEGTIITVMRESPRRRRRRRPGTSPTCWNCCWSGPGMRAGARRTCCRCCGRPASWTRARSGFVHLLEGVGAYVHGDPFTTLQQTPVFGDVPAAVARVEYPVESESTASARRRWCAARRCRSRTRYGRGCGTAATRSS
jgi:hypothetical protein